MSRKHRKSNNTIVRPTSLGNTREVTPYHRERRDWYEEWLDGDGNVVRAANIPEADHEEMVRAAEVKAEAAFDEYVARADMERELEDILFTQRHRHCSALADVIWAQWGLVAGPGQKTQEFFDKMFEVETGLLGDPERDSLVTELYHHLKLGDSKLRLEDFADLVKHVSDDDIINFILGEDCHEQFLDQMDIRVQAPAC